MEAPVKALMDSPKLPLYFEQLRKLMQDERRRREKFLDEIEKGVRAEFINGEVCIRTPAKHQHSIIVGNLVWPLKCHIKARDPAAVCREKSIISLTRNDYEPDICFFSKEKSKDFAPKQFRFPAPDFVVEVLSESTARNDRGVKFEDYAAHGISEYWIIDPETKTLEQYILKNGEYVLELATREGQVRSKTIQGFEIPISDIFDFSELG